MTNKQSVFSIIIYCMAFCSCQNWDIVDEPQKDSFTPNERSAIKRAGDFLTELYGKESRGEERVVSGITPILQNSQSRNVASNDTIAYVINYRNNNGFAIVAHSENIHHLLAFSGHGQFSFENEIAVAQFVNNINGYIETNCSSEHIPTSRMQEYFRVVPFMGTYLGQDYPYNQIIDQYYPQCLAGCVPVALAGIILYSKSKDTIVGKEYDLSAIRYGLETKTVIGDNEIKSRSKVYTLEEAQERAAHLLYGLGTELAVNYGTEATGGSSYTAYQFLRKKGYDVKTAYRAYDGPDIVRNLAQNHIIYMRGVDYRGEFGHAWVCDGCYYILSGDFIGDIYLHFDWGWQGYCNGFYHGDIFNVSINGKNKEIVPVNYFAVEREY